MTNISTITALIFDKLLATLASLTVPPHTLPEDAISEAMHVVEEYKATASAAILGGKKDWLPPVVSTEEDVVGVLPSCIAVMNGMLSAVISKAISQKGVDNAPRHFSSYVRNCPELIRTSYIITGKLSKVQISSCKISAEDKTFVVDLSLVGDCGKLLLTAKGSFV